VTLALAGVWCLILPAAAASQTAASAQSKPDFAHDVLPILRAHCYQCHGAGQQQGGLNLDSRAAMLKGGMSGTAVTPGKSANSLLLRRILGLDGKPRMPLGFGMLAQRDIDTLTVWINQGAVWSAGTVRKHWAYIKPVRPHVPVVKNAAWVRNPIDAFILANLEKHSLKPSPEADRITLIRRLTLDLTGLPPTPREVDQFLADKAPGAYERLVDRLFASPHYGERMALPWLDTARYADSNGFQQDGDTYQYVWRDWVVRAMNANMPFDEFTIDQLAGDLLPHPTIDTRIATGFNRCHMLNGEGGAIAEEQRNVILFDRVDVTATTWMAATMACAQCHNHKYDPYTQKDYYSFLSFFNNVPENGTPPGGGQYRIADPWIRAGSEMDNAKLQQFADQLDALQSREADYLSEHASEIAAAQSSWETAYRSHPDPAVMLSTWQAAGPFGAATFDAAFDSAFEPELHPALAVTTIDGKIRWTPHPEWQDGAPHDLTGENSATYLGRTLHTDGPTTVSLSFGSDDGIKVWLNGKLVVTDKATRAVAPDQDKATLPLNAGDNVLLVKIVNGGGPTGFYFKVTSRGLPESIRKILAIDAGKRSQQEAKDLRDRFLQDYAPPALVEIREKRADLQKQRDMFQANLPQVMVMSDAQPRVTHLLDRGNYLSPREVVSSETPQCLPAMSAAYPKNRLGLAEWLVSADNPLTARVQVNRYWQMFFGTGIAKTSENLGTQCDPPSNPQLLDWLAVEFRESRWNVKRMQRLMVISSTYRQSSRVTPEIRRIDPENRLLSHAARFRLPSLILRDVALSASGLLNPAIGGKPVYPYQPKGIWDGLAITNERDFTYPASHGTDLYRRSLYTFWRRTVAPANMFDASVRNVCKVRLTVTSTPLHALTTLNDVTWVEAGRVQAEHVMKEAGTDPSARLREAFRRVCARKPTADELIVLNRCLERARTAFKADPKSAEEYLKAGESPRDSSLEPVEHAAYATVCLAIFNLDEALTRE
jgi:hypothetical protein